LFTQRVTLLLSATSMICFICEPPFFLKLLLFTKLLFPCIYTLSLHDALPILSAITPPALLVNVTGVAPLPPRFTLPLEEIFTVQFVRQNVWTTVALPVTLLVDAAGVVSSPAPVSVPPDQLNALFTVMAPLLAR